MGWDIHYCTNRIAPPPLSYHSASRTIIPPPHLLRKIRAQAREFSKLTHRRPIGGSPLSGQRIRVVHPHLPPAARAPSLGPSCVLTHRRPIGGSPLSGQRIRVVHPHLPPSCVLHTSKIVHRQAARRVSPTGGATFTYLFLLRKIREPSSEAHTNAQGSVPCVGVLTKFAARIHVNARVRRHRYVHSRAELERRATGL